MKWLAWALTASPKWTLSHALGESGWVTLCGRVVPMFPFNVDRSDPSPDDACQRCLSLATQPMECGP